MISEEQHKIKGHTKLVQWQFMHSSGLAIEAGWKKVPGAEPRMEIVNVLGPREGIDMWRWVDKKGDFVF